MAGLLEQQDSPNKAGSQYVVHDVEGLPPIQSIPPSRQVIPDDGQIVSQHERLNLLRGLSQRHVQMIAIAGAIVCYLVLTTRSWLGNN